MTIHAFPSPIFHLTPPDRPLELGFISPHNALDRRTFSGTPFHAAQALKQQSDIRLRLIGNHRSPGRLDRLLRPSAPSMTFGADDLDGLDAVVGMVATPLLSRLTELRPDLPFLHVTDATPAFLRDVYGWAVPSETDALETHVASRAAACVYSSTLLADRAARDLNLPELASCSLPFGINFDSPITPASAKPALDQLELLFIGRDWARKGGDIAVAALDVLIASGVKARLTVVGACPEQFRDHPAIRVEGFLDKNRPRGAQRLSRLYGNAHLLLLPTRADCTPMVIGEAMAHATPVLAADTGGIRQQIGGQGAGQVLPQYASPETWAASIKEITATSNHYQFLSDAALDRAQTYFSWTVWAEV